MSRVRLIELLRAYRDSERFMPEETESLDKMLDFAEREPACFERSTEEGHFTGSAWIISHDRTSCVLTHHKKLGIWLQPGGHADGHPNLLEVAHREAIEESGIQTLRPGQGIFDVDVHAIPARAREPAHLHYDVRFFFLASEGATLQMSEESNDLAWVRRKDLPRLTSERSVLRMGQKWSMST